MTTNSSKIGYVYCHINKVNGRRYIGKTVQKLSRRFRKDDGTYNSYKSCKVFYAALQKYGWEGFETVILKIASLDEIIKWEEYYIKQYNTIAPNGYNTIALDNGLNVYSEETKRKISQKMKEVYKKKPFVPHNKNHHITINGVLHKKCLRCNNTKELSVFNKNRSTWDGLTSQCKECRIEMHREKYNTNPDIFKIVAITEDGSEIVFDSKEDAKRQLGTRNKSVLEAIRTGKQYYGCFWKQYSGA
jgi:group I intron endonuclease